MTFLKSPIELALNGIGGPSFMLILKWINIFKYCNPVVFYILGLFLFKILNIIKNMLHLIFDFIF